MRLASVCVCVRAEPCCLLSRASQRSRGGLRESDGPCPTLQRPACRRRRCPHAGPGLCRHPARHQLRHARRDRKLRAQVRFKNGPAPPSRSLAAAFMPFGPSGGFLSLLCCLVEASCSAVPWHAQDWPHGSVRQDGRGHHLYQHAAHQRDHPARPQAPAQGGQAGALACTALACGAAEQRRTHQRRRTPCVPRPCTFAALTPP